jgi:hypothetical protein
MSKTELIERLTWILSLLQHYHTETAAEDLEDLINELLGNPEEV